jgi:PhnB protein
MKVVLSKPNRYSVRSAEGVGDLERARSRVVKVRVPRKETVVTSQVSGTVISVMLAVADAPTAAAWYKHALGAKELWSLGSVVGMEIAGASFFLGEPANNGWESPAKLGITSTRVEVFCDDPDTFIARALEAGAKANLDIQDRQRPWGTHRQGAFINPFGHIWFVGDKSPLDPFP